eukprot:CAMPEP_0177686492 /NCGR_PEP_ID=MMETSP0447-20121125/33598_1 /TAXON_ID=0 /ORGANISM="Stygamoeba regulata, Strain BSH-02190019" /LENGTH=239 /DNA_ID=CAMNT_0019196619 /DNA_START=84 /DNA_END=799 /DNA_ORIENTATION=+
MNSCADLSTQRIDAICAQDFESVNSPYPLRKHTPTSGQKRKQTSLADGPCNKKIKSVFGIGNVSRKCITVVSGGQTGADRAALEAAKMLNLKTGGVAPPGYLTSAGQQLDLKTVFGLSELACHYISMAACYVKRSQMNVDKSDGTVAFRVRPSAGTDKTIGYCLTRKWKAAQPSEILSQTRPFRPVLVISTLESTSWQSEARRVIHFLQKANVRILNVCGHRLDSSIDPGWQNRVRDFL